MVALADHASLRDIAALKTGGAADYLANCHTPKDIFEVIGQARELKVGTRTIGSGSSLLISDSGYPGVVIRYLAQTHFFIHDKSQVIVDAGMSLKQLLATLHSHGYSGLEFLIDLPGTIGGAIYNNKSRFGYQLSEHVRSVTLLLADGKETILSVDRDWFEFSYGSSKLKRLRSLDEEKPLPIIVSVTLQLSKMNHESCLQKIHYFRQLQKNFPIPPVASLQIFNALSAYSISSAQVAYRKQEEAPPLYFLDKATTKQLKSGDIVVYSDNPNYLLNTRIGSSRDASELIDKIQTIIEDKYQAKLTPEVEFLGLWDKAQ